MTSDGPRCHEDHCITCSDDGTPMRVLTVDEARELALCAGEDGERATVEVAIVGPGVEGEKLLVHAGTALARLEATARCVTSTSSATPSWAARWRARSWPQ